MIPPEFVNKKPEVKYRRWPYVVAIALFVIIDLAIGYLIYKNYYQDAIIDQTTQESVAPEGRLTQISSLNQQLKSPSASETESIQALADQFMQARLDRSLDKAKPYVTSQFLEKYDQDGFAGVSSPSLDDYEVIDINYIGSNTYRIVIQTFWKINGDEAGSKDWTLIATSNDKTYKINDYSGE